MTTLPFFASIPVEHRDQSKTWIEKNARGPIGIEQNDYAVIVWFSLEADFHAFTDWFGQNSDCYPLSV